MAEQCVNGWGKGKNIYRTRAQAEKVARRTKSGLALHVYLCKLCRQWHLSKEAPHNKGIAAPSSSKLRRRLENAAAQIAATERRLTAAERAYFEELDFIERETARIMAGRTK